MVECDILKTSIAKKTYILHTIITILISLNSSFIIHGIILPFCIQLRRNISLKTFCNGEAFVFVCLVNITCSVSVTSSNQDNLIFFPRSTILKQFVCSLPCCNGILIVTTIITIITSRIFRRRPYVITCWMQEYNIFINNPDCQFRYK